MVTRLYPKLLRALSVFWRFNGLRLARRAFRRVESSLILDRRFAHRRLYLDVSRTNAQRLLYLIGERFVQEKVLIRKLVDPGMTVVDVGANIGYYMLLFAQFVGPEGKVLCFEPEPSNLIELRLNRNRNRLENVEICAKAVGLRNGKARVVPGLNGKVSNQGTLEVPIVKLDSALKDEVHAIKIDVEGYEGAVLFGAVRTISKYRPNLIVEIHPRLATDHSHKNVFGFIEDQYRSVEYYELCSPTFLRKASQQYLGRDPLVQIRNRRALLNSCMNGSRTRTFWAMCHN